MGCNSSSVVPLGDADAVGGAGIKVRVNPSTPETIKLSPGNLETRGRLSRRTSTPPLESVEPPVETLTKDFNRLSVKEPSRNKSGITPLPPLAFDVPMHEESLIKKHPPKKFRRLEYQDVENSKPLTREDINMKQREAEMRRKEILNLRILSAQQKSFQNRKLIRADAMSEKSEDSMELEKKW